MNVLIKNIDVSKDKNCITITHEKMDELLTIVENIELKSLCYYPTMEEIEIMKADIQKYYTFILWVLSNPDGPSTKEEIESEKELNRIIMKYTKFKKVRM
jgi:hypothetical protein